MTVMIQRIRLAALSAVLFAPLSGLGLAHAARARECLTMKAGAAHEIGRLSPGGGEKSYCVYARPGQTMKVTVKPLAPDMVTQGHVVSPISRQNDGGPGGVIFDRRLSEEGRYEIHVGQRFEKKSGAFELSVELK